MNNRDATLTPTIMPNQNTALCNARRHILTTVQLP